MTENDITLNLSDSETLQQALKNAGINHPGKVKKLAVTGTFNHVHFDDIFEIMGKTLNELNLTDATYNPYFKKKRDKYDYFLYYGSKEKQYHELSTGYVDYGLKSIAFPVSVDKLSPNFFRHFRKLTSIAVPDSHPVFSIENGVLFNRNKTVILCHPAAKMGEYVIPDTVVEVGDYAFCECKGLTSIALPQSVSKIGEDAFYHCTGLKSIVFPPAVTSIGENAFEECTGLKSVVFPRSVVSIGSRAFYRCKGLEAVTIVNPAIRLDEEAFAGCSELKSLDMPKSVRYKQNCVFDYCKKLPLYIQMIDDNEKKEIKQAKVKQMQETGAFEWTTTLLKDCKYPYKIIRQQHKLQALVMINEKQKLAIHVPYKNFQTILPNLMEAIQHFVNAISDFDMTVYIDNMINDTDEWVTEHLPKKEKDYFLNILKK